MQRHLNPAGNGFSLIELLVVITIIGILAGLGMTMLGGAQRDAEEQTCKATILSLTSALDSYKNDRRHGAFPPTSLEGKKGLGKLMNRTNMGAESLFVALSSPSFKGDKPAEEMGDDSFANLDEDQSQKSMTVFGATDLFSFLDPWGNPFAYFNAADYADPKLRSYRMESGDDVTVRPWKNTKTKSYFQPTSYQLFSAGPDGEFNTEDDIGNWDLN